MKVGPHANAVWKAPKLSVKDEAEISRRIERQFAMEHRLKDINATRSTEITLLLMGVCRCVCMFCLCLMFVCAWWCVWLVVSKWICVTANGACVWLWVWAMSMCVTVRMWVCLVTFFVFHSHHNVPVCCSLSLCLFLSLSLSLSLLSVIGHMLPTNRTTQVRAIDYPGRNLQRQNIRKTQKKHQKTIINKYYQKKSKSFEKGHITWVSKPNEAFVYELWKQVGSTYQKERCVHNGS